jgi:hypothetical protein
MRCRIITKFLVVLFELIIIADNSKLVLHRPGQRAQLNMHKKSSWLFHGLKCHIRLSGGCADENQQESSSSFESPVLNASSWTFHYVPTLLHLTVRSKEDEDLFLSITSNTTIYNLRTILRPLFSEDTLAWCGENFEISLNANDLLPHNSTLDDEGIVQNDRLFILPYNSTNVVTKSNRDIIFSSSANFMQTALLHDSGESDGDRDQHSTRASTMKEVAFGLDRDSVGRDDSDELKNNIISLPSKIRIANHPDGINASILIFSPVEATGKARCTGPADRRNVDPVSSWADPVSTRSPVSFAGRSVDGHLMVSDPNGALGLEEELQGTSATEEEDGCSMREAGPVNGHVGEDGEGQRKEDGRLMDLCDELILVGYTPCPFLPSKSNFTVVFSSSCYYH